jgi:Cof subfamily protein (haloacid dehalogenase superfamily)
MAPDEELHRHWAEDLARADALLFGRITYEMMQAASVMIGSEFKGVVFDVDGTLLTSRHEVSPRMLAVCHALSEIGVWLSIASARPPRSILLIGDAIKAAGPSCALNGAIILGRDGAILQRLSVQRETSQSLVKRFSQDDRVSLNLYSGMDWVVPRLDDRVLAEAAIVGYEPVVDGNLGGNGGIEKILLMTEETLAASLAQHIAAEYRHVNVSRSKPCYVEITSAAIDKARGVEEAARRVGLSLGDIVACGDAENDVSMLERAGFGISMGHGPDQLRRVARRVVGSNDDDSLPMALQKLFAIQSSGD